MRVKFDPETPGLTSYRCGANAAGSMWIRSIRAGAVVSTLERIDTVKLKSRGVAEYSVVLCCHHLPSRRVTGLPRAVFGLLHYFQIAGALGRALTDPARSALHRSS